MFANLLGKLGARQCRVVLQYPSDDGDRFRLCQLPLDLVLCFHAPMVACGEWIVQSQLRVKGSARPPSATEIEDEQQNGLTQQLARRRRRIQLNFHCTLKRCRFFVTECGCNLSLTGPLHLVRINP